MELARSSTETTFPAVLDVTQSGSGAPPQQRDVTLLFADLRESSRLTTTLDNLETFGLLAQVMECLTAAVVEHGGLIIDYYGDGLAAMWNAPADQPEHAELGSRAALRMLESIECIAANWSGRLERGLRLGVGVHSGAVQIGNVGSRHRPKYGPRGPNVNLASRVEAATKLVGLPLLITDSVVSQLSTDLVSYRVCRAEFSGLHRSVNLFSLVSQPNDALGQNYIAAYESALALFEQGELEQASEALTDISSDSTTVPAPFLAEQIEQARGIRKRRRSTDGQTQSAAGVVKLNVK